MLRTAGELRHAAEGFEASFSLAPRHATGRYQGLLGMGSGPGAAIGPALLIAVCVERGPAGWWLVGVPPAGAGALIPAAGRWAEHTGRTHADGRGRARGHRVTLAHGPTAPR